MKRRKFIQSTAVASALPLTYLAADETETTILTEKELYELRTYEMKFARNHSLLTNYLKDVLQPTLKNKGATYFQIFNELGEDEPRKIWLLIAYPNQKTYLDCQLLDADLDYQEKSKDYHSITPDQAVYNRFSSSLSLAFDGMPKMTQPIDGASLYELRIYEGYSEDAVRRKIKMFNEEEFPLFFKVKLNPVFFGDVIAGQHRPCLVYMLNFKDMEARKTAWSEFLKSPEWDAMKVKPEYANTVSNIRKVLLKPF
ncbi:MAG: NIPSNAP family protein [Bacteroidetes bacterium]|jgi:hypothetical protein|nr:NIPSNAP family protein [Bacteroidota bacterium]MDF1863962.1 NIPSNAP family protein [Saprospiraceae bacterium]